MSIFSINEGQSRGEHFHHTKVERFFVISGKVTFSFVNVISSETWEVTVDESDRLTVDSIPGWWHKVINVGRKEAKLLVWASENFEKSNPDTVILSGLKK